MFNPSRDEARMFLIDTWRKRRAGALLSPLEDLAAQLIEKHPDSVPDFPVLSNIQDAFR